MGISAEVAELQAVLHRYCASLAGAGHDAEDLAQETWLKAWGTLRADGHANPEAYMLRVAKNLWIDRSRRETAFRRILVRERPEIAKTQETSLFTEEIFQALTRYLSPLQRAVFLLRDVFGFTAEECSSRLGTTEGAVKAALHRARQALADVRRELERGELSAPEDEGLKTWLSAMAQAYRTGDVAALVELVRSDAVPAVVAYGLVQSRAMRRAAGGASPRMRMAA